MFRKSAVFILFLVVCVNRDEGAPVDWILHRYPNTDVLCFIVDFRYFCPSISSSSLTNSMPKSCMNGQTHSFHSLEDSKITPQDLLRWIIPFHIIEQYADYLAETNLSIYDHRTICNCTSNSIGQYCEYNMENKNSMIKDLLSIQLGRNPIRDDELATSFIDEIKCQIGEQSLQWRQICNGIVDCEDGIDELNCDLLQFHRCHPDEFQCRHGLCIPQEFAFDGMFDCLDSSDEQEISENLQLYKDCSAKSDPICDDRLCQKNEFSCGDGQCVQWTAVIDHRAGCQNLRHVAYRCDAIDDSSIRQNIFRGICIQTTFSWPLIDSINELNCIVGIQLLLVCNSKEEFVAIANIALNNLKKCPDLIEYPPYPVISPILHIFYNKSELMDLAKMQNYTKENFPPQPRVVCLNGSMICHGSWMSLKEPYCMSYDQFLSLTSYPFLPLQSFL